MYREDLTKAQQADVAGFERLMKRFAKHGLMMLDWSGSMQVLRVKDYDLAMEEGLEAYVIDDLDTHGMQSGGGDPD